MNFTKEDLRAVISGTEVNRIEALRQLLGYPVKQRDPSGSQFWYLRPGEDEQEASETCPIAVSFYEELERATDQDIKRFLTSKEKQQEIYGHYTNQVNEQQPVMYLLLPTKEGSGRVPLVLPTEGGLRQKHIHTFDWNDAELIARLNRLKQGELPIASSVVCSIPQVDWVFYPTAKTASELARSLAEAAHIIEQAIPAIYNREGKNGYLHKLLTSFQKELLPTLKLQSDREKDYSFADIYAQTIAYALFTARVFSYVKDKRDGSFTHFDRESAWQQLPETNPFLRKLFEDISKQSASVLGDELIGAIADIFGILRAAKMDAILSDFQLKMNREDIVIRFYEDFLAAYKPQMRERRGVYYTPEPVVSYMVRSVDILVKDKFNKPLGLADPDVEILDPACGTGTFLLWIFRLIYERFHNERQAIIEKVGDISWSEYVRKHLLNRIYGFELLMAPYAIAHLKLSLFLQETGYQFDSGKRLEVILSNTLDTPERKSEVLLGEYISEESDRAVAIKRDQPVMLVIGNPPYSYESENTGEWITSLVRDYYKVDGQPLGERNPKGLQDDYVKFIRFAQWKIEKTGQGILAFISNHGFLDNPTFRGMRQQLTNSFDALYFCDLHGNIKKFEKQNDGLPDANVFDIQQGVSITFGMKNVVKSILHCHLFGNRNFKYEFLLDSNIESTKWQCLFPTSPFYLFTPQNSTLLPEYQQNWKITDIFPVNSTGVLTARDSFTINNSKEKLWQILNDFVAIPTEVARSKYDLKQDSQEWEVKLAQQDIVNSGLIKDKIYPILYRPFDTQFTYFTGKSRGFHSRPRGKVMHHLIAGNNLAILVRRQYKHGPYSYFLVTNSLVEVRTMENAYSHVYALPLFIYPDDNQISVLEAKRYPNFSIEFLEEITSKLGYTPTPETIFYYIYGIFFSPTYRTRYAEFLKTDFPRVPLTSNNELFCQLAEYGEELVALHLMNQYWLIFKHRDADNLLHNVITFLGIIDKHTTYKILRIDPKSAKVFEYTLLKEGNLPSSTLLRTSQLKIIEKFLKKEGVTKEKALLAVSFVELKGRRRKFTLPLEVEKYNTFICSALERTQIYRRSTAYFNSGVLKLYEEPLQNIVQAEGQIRLLMDWQGFTKKEDVRELQKLQDPDYRNCFIRSSLEEFIRGLEESAFTSTQIMAELIRLGLLQIRLVKMDSGRAIYHKKTGILSDVLENHILHEGSDNFTRAAYTKNAEGITFLYSWDNLDTEAILDSIRQFDVEWQRQDITFDLSQEFLQQVLIERDRRTKLTQPAIESIAPDKFPPGETTQVEITGKNLDKVETIEVVDDDLVKVTIDSQQSDRIIGQVEVDPDHPPTQLKEFQVTTNTGVYPTSPERPPEVTSSVELPEFEEIAGFKQAIEIILAGQNGTPKDFLYWLAQQRPHQFRVEGSDLLDRLVNQGILFEHQKSGAQHCLRVMQDFGVAVCADAVGLGKTRLAAAVGRLYRSLNTTAKIAIIAAKKLHPNWEREMAELGFNSGDYELYNKNLMSRKGQDFQTDFNRYGGPDLVVIDEAHEGIRNYNNRIHKTCLAIQQSDRASKRQRHFLLLTATPWNNRREDIYNILSPFLSRPQGFTDLGFPPELVHWFQNRETGVETFTDNTELFRRTYRELFLQRTRQMLRDATPDMNLYAKRVAQWLPVEFELSTEQALDQIFTQFENSLYIPFADPIRYLTSNVEQRSLLVNQRRFFLQRAESSMYALRRTIKSFGNRITQMQQRLEGVSPDANGLKEFLLIHYDFESEKKQQPDFLDLDEREIWDEDNEEQEEDEEDTNPEQQQKRSSLRRSIDINTDALRNDPVKAQAVYDRMVADCEGDLKQLERIQQLLAGEFVIDHKREQVTKKVRELVSEGHKVLLISTFADTVIDYYHYMTRDSAIVSFGIGMAVGSTKKYYSNNSTQSQNISPNNILRGTQHRTGLNRQDIFRLFAPVATCKNPRDRPRLEEELAVLIGSETLSVGQNLQDADYLINIDLPWNPMILEQRIGRIDRPKQHKVENIYIYYANSESQLLRQASRLKSLNKKLMGLANDGNMTNNSSSDIPIPIISTVETLGASVYGDTLFDDEVLPGYIDFLESLVKVRQLEQGNLQEEAYKKQEANRDLYTQNEILHTEELSKLVKQLGEDYQANPITLGRRTGEKEEPTGLVAISVEYFGPNGEPIVEMQQTLFWNDQTGEKDGYGMAIATAFKTPDAGDVFSAKHLLKCATNLYNELVVLKQQRLRELKQEDSLENISITSERISKIQRRISKLDKLPFGLDKVAVKTALKKLNAWKEQKSVQKLLREYTDGKGTTLDDESFLVQLVQDTDKLNLIVTEGIKPTGLQISLAALLLRA